MLEEGKQRKVSAKVVWMWILTTAIAGTAFSQSPQLTFKSRHIELGKVQNLNHQASARFSYCNYSNDTLRFLNLKTASCNALSYSRAPIAPGDCGWIELVYHGTAQSGLFRKQATVSLQNGSPPIIIELSGEIASSEKPEPTKLRKPCP